MSKNTGVIIDRDVYGRAKMLHIDITKYADKIESIFRMLGIESDAGADTCPYNKKFQKKLDKSIKEAESGQVTRIDVENLWK